MNCKLHNSTQLYKPRNPQSSDYFKCTQDLFEEIEMVWEARYERQCGFWWPYVHNVIYRYLDCGDLRSGFARVKCADCNHDIFYRFHVNAAISAPHAIKKE